MFMKMDAIIVSFMQMYDTWVRLKCIPAPHDAASAHRLGGAAEITYSLLTEHVKRLIMLVELLRRVASCHIHNLV